MSEPIFNKIMRFRKEALKSKSDMEKSKLHKIKVLFLPTYQKKYIIACSVIECCNQLLNYENSI